MGMYGWHDNKLTAAELWVDKLVATEGRFSTASIAGTTVTVDASTWSHGEGLEFRFAVSDWADVFTLNQFQGMYLRVENQELGTNKTLRGAEITARDNNVGIGVLHGLHVNSYIKGTAASKTIGQVDGIQAQIEFANNVGTRTVTNDSSCLHGILYARTTVTGLTNLHGLMLDFGDQAGGSPTMGCGIYMLDNTGVSGTAALTYGMRMTLATTTGVSIEGASTTGVSITGTCSTAGILLGTTNKISFHDAGIYMRASADGHFEIVSDDTITLSAPGHGGIVFGGETDWGTGATGPDLDGTGWDWVTQTVGRVNTENITAAAYSGQYTALTVTKGQNLTSSFFANWNELYISASSVMTGASNFASIWGQVELGATVTSTDSEDFMAAVYGNFKTGATFTNNTKVCGFLAQSEVATSGLTNNGTISAYYAMKKSGCQVWDHGLYIADSAATTGIQLGDATTGIQLDGTFSGNAIAVTQDALTVGDSYSGVRVAVTAAAPTNAYGMAAYFDTTVTGTQADNIYNTGSWINMGSGYTCAANKLTVAFEGGIYDGGATLTDAWFIGLQLQMVTASAPTTRNWFRFNYNDGSSGSMTAIFAAANPGSAAFASGAGTTSTKNGDIAIADIVGTGVVYVRTYDAAG